MLALLDVVLVVTADFLDIEASALCSAWTEHLTDCLAMQGTNVELRERVALLEVNVNKAQAKLQEEQASCTVYLH